MALIRRHEWTPWLVLGASLLLTAAATAFTAWSARARDTARFENATQNAHDRIISRLEVYQNALRGTAALVALQEQLSAEEFRRYVDVLDIQRHYPGIQGIGWTERIASGWPASSAERHAIVYLEPLDERNQAAIGFDMSSEVTRRAAMNRARDYAEPSLSGRVILVQEIVGPIQPGFLLYVPVYRGGQRPPSLAQRRALLRGFAYAPFRANDLFAGIFGSETRPRVSFAVYDGTRADTTALLHQSPRTPGHLPRHTITETVDFAGRRWTISYASEPSFEAGSLQYFVPATLIAGLLVSAWLFWLARAQAAARAAAEAAASAKGRFLATMSHELRTPLNAIGGYVDLLELGIAGPIQPRQREYLARIQRAQQHLLGLINNILNFSRLDAGRVHFDLAPVPLQAIIAETRGYVAPLLDKRRLDFNVLPGPAVQVCADADKLRQILLNLLSNALKFTNAGGVVTLSWVVQERNALISVADTGIGIERDRFEQIFDPFVQVDADLARAHQGSGLGLAISRELARGMSGDITVESSPGAGSTFTLRLPLYSENSC